MVNKSVRLEKTSTKNSRAPTSTITVKSKEILKIVHLLL